MEKHQEMGMTITEANRNLAGRIVARSAEIYLASRATAAAFALAAFITDPGDFIS
jgi:homoaconitase/3-isopropylmalate dehydratase large subunit